MSAPLKEVATFRLARADYPRVRAMLGRSFFDYNLMQYALADPRRRAPAVTTLYGAMARDCLRRGEVHVAADFSGATCWLAPGTPLPSFLQQVRAGMLGIPWQFGLRGFQRLVAYDEVARRLHHEYAAGPHWYLAVIGVDRGKQGQGIGSALLRPMLARIDQEHLPCWLDTHQEENVRLYLRHGFEVAERVELPGHPIPVYGMLRGPR